MLAAVGSFEVTAPREEGRCGEHPAGESGGSGIIFISDRFAPNLSLRVGFSALG